MKLGSAANTYAIVVGIECYRQAGWTLNGPAIHGIQTGPTTRTPTLENGGIGNRYPQRDTAPSRPATDTKAPVYDANGNRR